MCNRIQSGRVAQERFRGIASCSSALTLLMGIFAFLLLSISTTFTPPALALTPPAFYHQADITNVFSNPARVATDFDGNIYVPDEDIRAVLVLGPSGNLLSSIGNSAIGSTFIPRSVAIDSRGNILVGYSEDGGSDGRVAIYDPSGRFLRYLGPYPAWGAWEFAFPSDIAVSYRTGRIYVLDSIQNTVKVYDGNGDRIIGPDNKPLRIGSYGHYDGLNNLSNPGKLDYPTGVAIDDIRQEVLVSDQNNFRIQKFDYNGAFKTAFGKHAPDITWGAENNAVYDFRGTFTAIRGLSVDKEGRIYVVDAFQGHVQVLDRTGAFLAFIGEYGTGSGQLKVPIDVTIDGSGRLIIVDWNNNRLSIFQTDAVPAYPNMPPPAPSLLSPAHAIQLGTTTPLLSVTNTVDINRDELSYEFQVDISSAFTSPSLASFVAPRGGNITSGMTPGLTDHTQYFWRVRAVETSTTELFSGNWSETRSFYLNAVNRPPSTPVLLLSAAGGPAKKTDLLSWSRSVDPDMYDTVQGYIVEISDQPDFSTTVLGRSGLNTTSTTLDTLAEYQSKFYPGVTYFWRVAAVDNHGAVAYSAPGSFIFKQTLLRITSSPAGARVYLDGNYGYLGTYSGTTDQSTEIREMRPGRHVVRVEKGGYFSYYTSVNIVDGEIQTVNAVLVDAAMGELMSQGRLRDETGSRIGNSSPAIDRSKPYMVDWNNDGRKDLLIGDASGRVYLYENTATDANPVFRLSTAYPGGVVAYSGPMAAPFVVDWDNDGRKDLLAGSGDGTVRLYLNEGSDEAPLFADYSILYSNGAAIQVIANAAPAVADWNNDGKKDLLIGESSGKVRLFLNSGSDATPSFDITAEVGIQGAYLSEGYSNLSVRGSAVVSVTDWNNDGKKDLLVGGSSGLKVFLNTGTDAAPAFMTNSFYDIGSDIAPIALDLNNDGYTDLLAGEESGGIRYFQFRKYWGSTHWGEGRGSSWSTWPNGLNGRGSGR